MRGLQTLAKPKAFQAFTGALCGLLSIFLTVAIALPSIAQVTLVVSGDELKLDQDQLATLLTNYRNWKLGERLGQGTLPARPNPYSGVFLEAPYEVTEGNYIVAEFMYISSLTLKELKGGPYMINGHTVSIGAIAGWLSTYSGLDSIFVTNKRIVFNGVPKDLLNDPFTDTILISKPSWEKATFEQKQLLILHEMLGILKIPDSSFEVSSELKAILDERKKTSKVPTVLMPSEMPKYRMAPIRMSGSFGNYSSMDDKWTLAKIKITDSKKNKTGEFTCDERRRESYFNFIREEKRVFINWLSRCKLPSGNTIELPPLADGDKDLRGWFDLDENRILQNGVEVGWLSGHQLFLKLPGQSVFAEFTRVVPEVYLASYVTFKVTRTENNEKFTFTSKAFEAQGVTVDYRLLEEMRKW